MLVLKQLFIFIKACYSIKTMYHRYPSRAYTGTQHINSTDGNMWEPSSLPDILMDLFWNSFIQFSLLFFYFLHFTIYSILIFLLSDLFHFHQLVLSAIGTHLGHISIDGKVWEPSTFLCKTILSIIFSFSHSIPWAIITHLRP
jgi:hypothetical protein